MRNRVLIAGAGPAGLCLAAYLTAENIPVCIFEAEPCLPKNLRASTFHPPTLDFLEPFGASKILIDEGIEAFESIGDKFDPEKHEALMSETSKKKENIIIKEFEKGYMYNDKILRHAKVVVSKK